ncbi:MAG: hypothetical protein ABUU24_09025, partial [Variovorax sp.]
SHMANRFFLALVLTTLAAAVRAENPPHECFPERGCQVEKSPTHDVGRGVILTLPEGWTYQTYPQAPIPEMAGLREIRAFKGGVDIAVTPFPNIDKREIKEDWVRDILGKACAPYAAISKEGTVNIVSMSHDELVGGYCSFSAKENDDKPFAVLPHRNYSNVTTFLVSHRFVILSVTVASELPTDDAYAEALSAIRDLK